MPMPKPEHTLRPLVSTQNISTAKAALAILQPGADHPAMHWLCGRERRYAAAKMATASTCASNAVAV